MWVADVANADACTCAQVRVRLGAKHVICVCSTYDSASVMAAAQRLLDCADVLRGVVDLSGAPNVLSQCVIDIVIP